VNKKAVDNLRNLINVLQEDEAKMNKEVKTESDREMQRVLAACLLTTIAIGFLPAMWAAYFGKVGSVFDFVVIPIFTSGVMITILLFFTFFVLIRKYGKKLIDWSLVQRKSD
jgi:polyferredoxin